MTVRHFYRGQVYELLGEDTFQQAAYRAERVAFGDFFEVLMPATSLEAVQLYVDGVVGSQTSYAIKAYHGRGWDGPNRVLVEDGQGWPLALGNPARIQLPLWGRTVPIVLHELAHCLVGVAVGHHWPWALAYVELTRQFVGRHEAAKLLSRFEEAGIRRPDLKRQETRG